MGVGSYTCMCTYKHGVEARANLGHTLYCVCACHKGPLEIRDKRTTFRRSFLFSKPKDYTEVIRIVASTFTHGTFSPVLFICLSVCLSLCLCLCVCVCYPWKPEEDFGFPGAGVAVVNCLLWVLGTKSRSCTRGPRALNV